jgi:hypothetical protein
MAKSTTEDVRAVMVETAKMQLATLNAGIEFWSGWVEGAGRFAQAINQELSSLGKDGAKANEVVSRITDSSRNYLATMSELPDRAVARFKADLKATRTASKPARRAARAKA